MSVSTRDRAGLRRLFTANAQPERWTVVARSGFATVEEAVTWLSRPVPVEERRPRRPAFK